MYGTTDSDHDLWLELIKAHVAAGELSVRQMRRDGEMCVELILDGTLAQNYGIKRAAVIGQDVDDAQQLLAHELMQYGSLPEPLP